MKRGTSSWTSKSSEGCRTHRSRREPHAGSLNSRASFDSVPGLRAWMYRFRNFILRHSRGRVGVTPPLASNERRSAFEASTSQPRFLQTRQHLISRLLEQVVTRETRRGSVDRRIAWKAVLLREFPGHLSKRQISRNRTLRLIWSANYRQFRPCPELGLC